ncbi:RNA methyltransferase [Brucella sp. H1_1004]|uniref:TrmH family RNA methyltransferase n=1 Tax=Brucella sp. H1_1004 TaxID=3110109 RepID=UPI0039B6478E
MSRDDDFSKSGNSHSGQHSGQRVGQVKEVTSLTNPIVKDLRSLALKKFRDQQGVFLAEGLKLVIDAFEQDWRIKTLVFAKSGKGNKMVEQVAARTFAKGGLVLEVTEKIMAAITRRDNPQMVVGVFEQQYQQLANLKPKGNDVYIALDRVRDPGNLGTVIRTADAVGAKGIILIGDTTDPYSLETVRATMGSVFSLPLYKTTESEFLNWRKGFAGLLVGTHLKGAVDYRTIPYVKKPVILMMGNEQQGLPDSLAESCDKLARIPQAGRADSLNLAIATGVMLYEIRRDALTLDERTSG